MSTSTKLVADISTKSYPLLQSYRTTAIYISNPQLRKSHFYSASPFGGIFTSSVSKGRSLAPSSQNSIPNQIHHPILSIPCCSRICITIHFNWSLLRYQGRQQNFQNPLEVHSNTYIAATTTTTTTEP